MAEEWETVVAVDLGSPQWARPLPAGRRPHGAARMLHVGVVQAGPVGRRLPGHPLARSNRSTIPTAHRPIAIADRSLVDAWPSPFRNDVRCPAYYQGTFTLCPARGCTHPLVEVSGDIDDVLGGTAPGEGGHSSVGADVDRTLTLQPPCRMQVAQDG